MSRLPVTIEAIFERFTERARRVMVLAQEEARLLNHSFIGTEHLLLGLLHEGEGAAAQALDQLGISLEAVRLDLEETMGSLSMAAGGSPPFTPRAKKVLELSLREAIQLGHHYIGTEHILLGIVREGEGVAARILIDLGADLSLVRQQVIQVISGPVSDDPTSSEPRPIGGATRSDRGREPRCPRCRSELEVHLRYRPVSARADAAAGGASEVVGLIAIYCGVCGNTIGLTPL
jgi:ATP-dependent Clp protease ATP-binding subunit ClpA